MDINRTTVELAGKLNKPRPFQVGDPVIHKSTGLCGWVEAVESYGTTDGQMLTVKLISGKYIRGLRREEFGLHTAGPEQVKAQAPVGQFSGAHENVANAPKLEGSISTASILDQLS